MCGDNVMENLEQMGSPICFKMLSNSSLFLSATSIAKLIAVKSSKQGEPLAHTQAHTYTHTGVAQGKRVGRPIKLVCIVMQMALPLPLPHTHTSTHASD